MSVYIYMQELKKQYKPFVEKGWGGGTDTDIFPQKGIISSFPRVDLQAHSWRFVLTPAAGPGQPELSWQLEIRGKYGTLYPNGQGTIAVWCPHRRIWPKLNSLKPFKVLGSVRREDRIYIFRVSKFIAAAEAIKAQKRHRLGDRE
ncbi:MAG: hypothetical protein PHF00_10265 [Elusimicrobia bacterium]|nr:hypothetical protein [Elusimicrobiota bacterium]